MEPDRVSNRQAESQNKPASNAPGSSPAFKAFLLLTVVAGGGLLAAGLWGLANEGAAGWVYFALLAAVTSSLGVRLPIRLKSAGAFAATLADCFTMLALLMFGWKAAVLSTAADGLAASVRFGVRSPLRMAFNTGQMCLATYVAAQLFWSLQGGPPPLQFSWSSLSTTVSLLVLTILFSFSINGAMVSTAVGLYSGTSPAELIRSHIVKLTPSSLTALAAAVVIWSPIPRPFSIPLALSVLGLGWTYMRWVRSRLA